ncbi:MAG: hypothetical protein R3D80_04045 [Paracoccaceae bacterium]
MSSITSVIFAICCDEVSISPYRRHRLAYHGPRGFGIALRGRRPGHWLRAAPSAADLTEAAFDRRRRRLFQGRCLTLGPARQVIGGVEISAASRRRSGRHCRSRRSSRREDARPQGLANPAGAVRSPPENASSIQGGQIAVAQPAEPAAQHVSTTCCCAADMFARNVSAASIWRCFGHVVADQDNPDRIALVIHDRVNLPSMTASVPSARAQAEAPVDAFCRVAGGRRPVPVRAPCPGRTGTPPSPVRLEQAIGILPHHCAEMPAGLEHLTRDREFGLDLVRLDRGDDRVVQIARGDVDPF